MASRRLLARCFQWLCIDALLALCIACIFDDASSSVQNWVPSVADALADPFVENFQLYVDHAVCSRPSASHAVCSRPSASPFVNATSNHNCTVLANNMPIALTLDSSPTSPWVSGVVALSPQFWKLDTFVTVEGEGMAVKFAPVDDFNSLCPSTLSTTTEVDYMSRLHWTHDHLQHSLVDALYGSDLSSLQVAEDCSCKSRSLFGGP
eukprot:129493-Amphidinium_carterae.1